MVDASQTTFWIMVLVGLPLVGVLLALAWIDIKTGLLPDVLTLSLMWAGLLVNLNGSIAPLQDGVLGAVAGYLLLWSANHLYRWRAGHDGMGYGDFKMTAALGAWFGIAMLPWIILGACVVGLGATVADRVKGHAVRPMPFGPCLSVAGITALLVVFSR